MKTNIFQIFLILIAMGILTTCEKDALTGIEPMGSDQVEMATNDLGTNRSKLENIFGPQTFNHAAGQKGVIHRYFNMGDEYANCMITVTNNGLSEVWIDLDEHTMLFTPDDFTDPNITYQSTFFVKTGIHTINIAMAGAQTGSVTITLEGDLPGPPPPIYCSEIAAIDCQARGWMVVGIFKGEGTLVCTIDGRPYQSNCDSCSMYNIYVWKDGAREQTCVDDIPTTPPYSTEAGEIYGGHIPCTCADNLFSCFDWDMENCIPDPPE